MPQDEQALTRFSRARGAVLGLAWGDVFGCPVEGWRASEIAEHYGAYHDLPAAYPGTFATLRPERRKKLRPLGLHSDDTQQALALVGAAMTRPPWARGAWVCWLVAGHTCSAWRGYGRNFDAAIHRLRRGVAVECAGSRTAGIGAAMRIGPLGALLYDDTGTLVRASMESSLVTHGDVRAGALAFAVAYAVARFVGGDEPSDVAMLLPEAVRAVEDGWLNGREKWRIDRTGGHQVSESLRTLIGAFRGSGDVPLPALRQRVSELARPHLRGGTGKAHPNQGFALLGGLHGLLVGLLAPGEPRALLAEIVRQGYDTDTVAAIAGTVLGARHGDRWIPTERLLDEARLQRWADAVAKGDAPAETRDVFLEAEAKRTAEERAFQRRLMD